MPASFHVSLYRSGGNYRWRFGVGGLFGGGMKKANKFRAKRITVDGIKFDSQKEAARWQELKLLERAKEIGRLERQVPIELYGHNGPILTDKTGKPRIYVADFRYIDWRNGGVIVIEDSKGVETPEFKLKRAILKAQGVTLTIT